MKREAFGLYKKKGQLPAILPDFVADNFLKVDFKELKQLGIKHILLDLDLTIRRVGARELEKDVLEFFRKLQDNRQFKSVNLVTNNRRAKRFADTLNIQAFMPYWEHARPIRKPNIKFFQRVLSALNAQPGQAAMIGDKVHADIVGANNVGMTTILVHPRGRDYWFDMLMLTRFRERYSIKKARHNIKNFRKPSN